MVFAGKVVGFEYRKGIPNQYVKFQVERWWKGEATTEVFLITSETKKSDGTSSRSSCDSNFKEGESYLVYAYGKENKLRTHVCMRTRRLTENKDLEILGKGKEPIEKKDEPNKSLDVRRGSFPHKNVHRLIQSCV